MHNRIKELRENNNLTLSEMAEQTGIKRGTINNYENGKTEPKLKTWEKLAKFFSVPVGYIQGLGLDINTIEDKFIKLLECIIKNKNFYNKVYDEGQLIDGKKYIEKYHYSKKYEKEIIENRSHSLQEIKNNIEEYCGLINVNIKLTFFNKDGSLKKDSPNLIKKVFSNVFNRKTYLSLYQNKYLQSSDAYTYNINLIAYDNNNYGLISICDELIGNAIDNEENKQIKQNPKYFINSVGFNLKNFQDKIYKQISYIIFYIKILARKNIFTCIMMKIQMKLLKI